MRGGHRSESLLIYCIYLVFFSAFLPSGCQAQIPGLGRPLGPGAAGAVQPATAPGQLGAKPAAAPGVTGANPTVTTPALGSKPATAIPGVAQTTPGAATPANPISGLPGGTAAVPGIAPKTPDITNPLKPAAASPPIPGNGLPAAVIPGITPGITSSPSPLVPTPPGALPSGQQPGTNIPPGLQRPATPSPAPGLITGPTGGVVPGVAGLGPQPIIGTAGQVVPGAVLVPSPAVAGLGSVGTVGGPALLSSPAPSAASATAASAVAGQSVALGPVTINPGSTTVRSGYTWLVSKRFTSQGKTLALSIPAGTGTGTANYQLTVTKSLATQVVTVAGSFTVTGSGSFGTPVLTFAPSPAAKPSGTVSCQPPSTAPASCSFQQSWSDNSIAAAAGGVVTVTLGASTVSAPYSFAGVTGGTTGGCATVTDNFSAGQLTGTNMQMSGNYPPAGMQVCDIGDKLFEYSITFSNMQQTWCNTPMTAINTVTVTPTDGGTPVTDSATVSIQVTGCTGVAAASGTADSSVVTVGGLKTVVINSYTWALTKTGGGTNLNTSPDKELSIPFTITATQTLTRADGWVAGTVSVSNVAGAITITAVSVDLGGTPQQVQLSNCQTTQVAAGGSTSCSFNVTAPSAPAAGSVTATVSYSPSGGAASTLTSAATPYSFSAAETYNLGGTATIYDTIDASSLNSIAAGTLPAGTLTPGVNTASNANNLVRISPPEQAPPTTAPGLTISGTQTYTYNVIVSRLMTCVNERTLTNTATLTPVGSSQTALTKSASATFTVTGCNVLPTVALSDIRTFAAVTWSWTLTKTASPSSYQLPVGSGATAQYQVQLTKTRSTGNYAMAGTLTVTNPATFPMYISSVTLMATTGQFGALPPACLGGSNVGGSTIAGVSGPGMVGPYGTTGLGNPYGNPYGTTTGSFVIAAGAQITCNFNVTAGSGAPPQGTVYAQATTTSSYVGSTGNTAISPSVPIDFNYATQQWDIGDCVSFSDNAVSQGAAGAWSPQLTNLPQQQRICDSRTYPYSAAISAVPMTGAVCNQAVMITNTATAVPDGGTQTQTATASIQVMATGCALPSPAPAPFTQPLPSPPMDMTIGKQLSSSPLVPSVEQSVNVAAVGAFEWWTSITSDADARGSLSIAYGSSRPVRYMVTARRRSAFTFYVSGVIKLTNNNDAPVSATSVSAQLPVGYVPAMCQGRAAVVVPASGNVLCAFNASITDPTPGTITAVVVSTFGTATSATAVPYSVDSAITGGKGACAILSDSVTTSPALAPGSMAFSDNKPYSPKSTPVCTDSSYNFTAGFGPFDEAACNSYVVTAEASATPTDMPQGTATSRNTLQLKVDGCPTTAQSVNTVNIAASTPVGRSVPSVRWSANTDVEWMNTIKYTDSKVLVFNVSWARADGETSRLAGTLTVTNPTAAAVSIKSAVVLPEFGNGSAEGAQSIDAQCKDTGLAPGASVNCSYTGTVPGAGAGSIVGQVMLSSGRMVSSAPTQFELPGRTRQPGSKGDSEGCADVITGLFLSPALLLPNRTLVNVAQQIKACSSDLKQVTVTVGPFTEDECGQYTVVLTTRIRPPATSGQLPFASLGVAKVVVVGCPLTETPKPETVIADGMEVNNIVRYPWRVNTSSDNADPLSLRYSAAQDVTVTIDVERETGQRSVALQGAVQVTAPGTRNLSVNVVQVAVLKRLGELEVVNATCPPESIQQDGSIAVPVRPGRLLCDFQVSGMPPMDGAITPLVYLGTTADAPLPAQPTTFRTANAPRVLLSECAVLSASRALRMDGSKTAVEGQPSTQQEEAVIPSEPVCGSFTNNLVMTFGPFKASQCGSYTFSGTVTAKPFNASRAIRASSSFAVEVTGCKRQSSSRASRDDSDS